MSRSCIALPFMLAVAVLSRGAQAQDSADTSPISLSGGFGFSFTRYVKSSAITTIDQRIKFLEKTFRPAISARFGIHADISPRIDLLCGMGGSMWWPTSPAARLSFQQRGVGAGLSHANAAIFLGNIEKPLAKLTIGFTGIRTSPDARFFGGYLFGGPVYPPVLLNGTSGNVSGLLLHSDYISWLRQDVVVSFEERYHPVLDLTVGYVAAVKPAPFIEIGGGIAGWHAMPMVEERTTPKNADGQSFPDAIAVVENGDTAWLSHRGARVMARFSFDPKKLLGVGRFEEGELRLYGETSLMGLREYPVYRTYNLVTAEGDTTVVPMSYDKIEERLPIMLGFNPPRTPIVSYGIVPAALSLALIATEKDAVFYDTTETDTVMRKEKRGFDYQPERAAGFVAGFALTGAATFLLERFIDARIRPEQFKIEVEYLNNPHQIDPPGYSVGPVYQDLIAIDDGHIDDWKWAVSANKKLFDRISLGFKAASDHLRTADPSWYWGGSGPERLLGPDEWYWEANIGVSF